MHSTLTENQIAKEVVDVAFCIHKQYGPALFESVYEEIVCYELDKKGLTFLSQQPIPLIHQEIKLDAGFRADIFVEERVLIELKSVESLAPIHYKQVQTYLKLTGLKSGLLINFNVVDKRWYS